MKQLTILFFLCLILSMAVFDGWADEGIWLYNAVPVGRLKQKYGTTVTPALLNKLRLSTVDMGTLSTGSLVSAHGLIAASHFPIRSCIAAVTRAEENLLSDGFYAPDPGSERQCPNSEALILNGIDDVTTQLSPFAEQLLTHRETVNKIERACTTTEIRCRVVPLYSGALQHLYKYRVYKDVRLVFAPESTVTSYAGNAIPFNFPRWDMTVCFLRIWENGKPAVTPTHLRWRAYGPRDGELVMQSANPRTTDRARPARFLGVDRDITLPLDIAFLEHLVSLLTADPATERNSQLRVLLDTAKNSLETRRGRLAALADEKQMRRKRSQELAVERSITSSPRLRPRAGESRSQLDKAADDHRKVAKDYWLFEAPLTAGNMFASARLLFRNAAEALKPDEERLAEFQEAQKGGLSRTLTNTAPAGSPAVYKASETALLTAYLRTLHDQLPADHPVQVALFGSNIPDDVAREAMEGSRLDRKEVRLQYLDGQGGAEASRDPLTAIVRIVDPYAREARRRFAEAETIRVRETARLAEAEFLLKAGAVYPEATGTLRLAWGRSSGTDGTPHAVRLGDWFALAGRPGKPPLPPRFRQAYGKLDLRASLTFVSDVDIANGHAGPTVDHNGNLVGILYASNYRHVANAYWYLEKGSRAVHMSSAGALEVLQKVYRAKRIVDELEVVDIDGHPLAK